MPQQSIGEHANALACPRRAHRLDGSEFLVANGATADMADLLLVRPRSRMTQLRHWLRNFAVMHNSVLTQECGSVPPLA